MVYMVSMPDYLIETLTFIAHNRNRYILAWIRRAIDPTTPRAVAKDLHGWLFHQEDAAWVLDALCKEDAEWALKHLKPKD